MRPIRPIVPSNNKQAFHFSDLLAAYDNHGVSKTFDDSSAVGLKNAAEKLNFQVRLLNQPKPTHQGGPPSLTREEGGGAAGRQCRNAISQNYGEPVLRDVVSEACNIIVPVSVTHYSSYSILLPGSTIRHGF